MDVSRVTEVIPQKGGIGSLILLTRLLWNASLPNILRALAAILIWSLVLAAASFCYELWRLERNLRLGLT